jgi:hypothetical protein
MEMTAVWEERKSKSPFPLFPHCLGKLAKTASFPHSHSFGGDLDFPFSPSSFNFNFDESVTYITGTFCYRYPRSHRKCSKTELMHPDRRWYRQCSRHSLSNRCSSDSMPIGSR